MPKLKSIVNLDDEMVRGIYFHEMSGNSRTLELLLNSCYRLGITPLSASAGSLKNKYAHIIFNLSKKELNKIGKLMDLTLEIPSLEFNVKSERDGIFAEISCDFSDREKLFTRIKDILEESVLDEKKSYNYTIMSTVYNIAKIVREVLDADIIFAVNEKLYDLGRCGLSIFKRGQFSKASTKKADDIYDVIEKLKTKSALHLPTVLFCKFEELRNFYFELDETVYSKDIEGENVEG